MSRVLAQDSMMQVLLVPPLGGTTVIMAPEGVTIPDSSVTLIFSDDVVTISELNSGSSAMTTAKPAELDICRVRGDTFPMVFTMVDTAGDPINIAGFSFLLTVDPAEEPIGAGNNRFQLAGAITDAAGGEVTFTMSAGQADQTPKEYFYDLQQTDTGGSIRTIAKGSFTFVQDITK